MRTIIPGREQTIRLLRAIGEKKARLRQDGTLYVRSSGGDIITDATAVLAMVSEGLLSRKQGDVMRTQAGRMFLRRALATASENPAIDQHREPAPRTVMAEGEAVEVIENAAESPLAWLSRRKDRQGKTLISAIQREAGERLFQDHSRAHQRQSVSASWDPTGVRSAHRRDGLSVTEAAEDARRRVLRALGAVGPGLADALVAVCCEELGLEALEKRFGWPARSGKVVLLIALDRLAAHYGLAAVATGADRDGKVLHWGTTGYRPTTT